MFNLSEGQKVLIIAKNTEDKEVSVLINKIKDVVGNSGEVMLKNGSDTHLSIDEDQVSHFDVAVVNIIPPYDQVSLNHISELLMMLKPSGHLIIQSSDESNLASELKLAGFSNINKTAEEEFITFKAFKPDFEVGSSVSIPLSNINSASGNSEQMAWKIDLNDADVPLDDPDDLLSSDDLKRPDPSSLKVCGTTGKRKACKNCVCGLKEELDAEYSAQIEAKKDEFKPSCGNCYLGDAFRCASCPYLGMPAFKPGEKVKLAESSLQD